MKAVSNGLYTVAILLKCILSQIRYGSCLTVIERSKQFTKPATAAMHGPHSLVRFGDSVRFGPIR